MTALAAKAASPATAPRPDRPSPPRRPRSSSSPDRGRRRRRGRGGPSAVPIVYDEDAAVDEPTRISRADPGERRGADRSGPPPPPQRGQLRRARGSPPLRGRRRHGRPRGRRRRQQDGRRDHRRRVPEERVHGRRLPRRPPPRRPSSRWPSRWRTRPSTTTRGRNAAYQGMGTTVVSARFSPNKQRVYFGHVGDSRCYRLRGQVLTQVTTDHTMGAQGVTGPLANHLNRAVGVAPGGQGRPDHRPPPPRRRLPPLHRRPVEDGPGRRQIQEILIDRARSRRRPCRSSSSAPTRAAGATTSP